ncbi:hypothetical protein [Mycobacteroides abscessus]|nr:hypothetical protein [Mycobacteroides abscessus]SLC71310.1 Uncharacterised protein [Mycobacteroides abscessus subsp. massiliense]SLJ48783.1 Uncharacterised protein [Mycobacteroides abscessus subsp. abscessus]
MPCADEFSVSVVLACAQVMAYLWRVALEVSSGADSGYVDKTLFSRTT